MAENPIIFSAQMIRAILAGRKTMTRRILKPQPKEPVRVNGVWHDRAKGGDGKPLRLPYAVGDRLWVREACRAEELSRPQFECKATAQERRIMKRTHVFESSELDGADGVRYLADDFWAKIENTPAAGEAWHDLYHYRGRAGKNGIGANVSPIHMPRWASRITLTVTAVKVERVQDISDEDARAEGITYQEPTAADLEWFKGWQEENCRDPNEPMDGIWTSGIKDTWGPTAQSAFMMLWRHIHGPGAWDRNDWVAAISFERTNADQA